MVRSWKILGEANRRWVPTRQTRVCRAGETTSGLCPSGAPHRRTLPPSGPRPAPQQRRGPPAWLESSRAAEPSHRADKRTASSKNKLVRDTMSLTQQTAPLNLPPEKPRRPASQRARPSKAETQQPRTVRLTVSLPGDLVDRLRDAVYWSPSLTLAWLIAQSLRTSLTEMESLRQSPFPKRTNALRAGRPRLVGQTMNLSPRARLTGNVTAPPAELVRQARPVSQPSIECE